MTLDRFNEVTAAFVKHCLAVLDEKGVEYAKGGNDRLAHFKSAATLLDNRPKTVLYGMLAKHLTALNDYCRYDNHNVNQWKEKLTDSVNYLILMWALVIEENTVIEESTVIEDE